MSVNPDKVIETKLWWRLSSKTDLEGMRKNAPGKRRPGSHAARWPK